MPATEWRQRYEVAAHGFRLELRPPIPWFQAVFAVCWSCVVLVNMSRFAGVPFPARPGWGDFFVVFVVLALTTGAIFAIGLVVYALFFRAELTLAGSELRYCRGLPMLSLKSRFHVTDIDDPHLSPNGSLVFVARRRLARFGPGLEDAVAEDALLRIRRAMSARIEADSE